MASPHSAVSAPTWGVERKGSYRLRFATCRKGATKTPTWEHARKGSPKFRLWNMVRGVQVFLRKVWHRASPCGRFRDGRAGGCPTPPPGPGRVCAPGAANRRGANTPLGKNYIPGGCPRGGGCPRARGFPRRADRLCRLGRVPRPGPLPSGRRGCLSAPTPPLGSARTGGWERRVGGKHRNKKGTPRPD